MQNRKKRIRILTNNEISELYQIPSFNSAEMELSADSFLDIVKNCKGNIILTGGAGSGKSTLIEQLRNEP